jgi:hypothetical protein
MASGGGSIETSTTHMVHRRRRRRRRRRREEEVGEGEGVAGEVVSRSLEQGRRAQGERRCRGGGSDHEQAQRLRGRG